ncbi:olfactory receptor 6C1-like [Bombina bombina]|uniref:olfactory receptor 6C1-like n=1 Tax=Bombina bombina TaxID=8345 RepID=UPI00235AFD62|nr:olfactory receptor 6C1-like [Bombina bombina]
MHKDNHTTVTEFILLGFHNLHNFQIVIFLLLTIMFTATIAANVLIIAIVTANHQFQSPMYIFLSHLSLSDIIISANIAPKALQVILLGKSTIPLGDCITQLYFFGASAILECCLLSVMSYDRYLAICKPLHYTTIMNIILLRYLIVWCWLAGFIFTWIIQIFIIRLNFCGPNIIDHFFCDLVPLLELSCSDTSIVQIEASITAMVISLFQLFFVMATYICIFNSILKTSTTRRQKAFSTCSSHLAVVCTYYGTIVIIYVSPSKGHSLNFNKALSFLNTAVTPLFNPIVYTLRNKEIRETIINVLRSKITAI